MTTTNTVLACFVNVTCKQKISNLNFTKKRNKGMRIFVQIQMPRYYMRYRWEHKNSRELFIYLIGHNNSINGLSACRNTSFQAPLLLARLRQLVTPIDDRTSLIWSLQWIQGGSLRRLPEIKYPSCWSILLHTNEMAEQAQTLNINTLHNVHVVE